MMKQINRTTKLAKSAFSRFNIYDFFNLFARLKQNPAIIDAHSPINDTCRSDRLSIVSAETNNLMNGSLRPGELIGSAFATGILVNCAEDIPHTTVTIAKMAESIVCVSLILLLNNFSTQLNARCVILRLIIT